MLDFIFMYSYMIYSYIFIQIECTLSYYLDYSDLVLKVPVSHLYMYQQ